MGREASDPEDGKTLLSGAMTLSPRPYLQEVSVRADAETAPDEYPFNIPAVANLGRLKFHPDLTFFVGENGAGKSTVLEAIAVALGFSPEGGTKNFKLQTTPSASVSPLHRTLRLARSFQRPADGYFLRAESFFNVATYMDEIGYLGAYGDRSLHERSHGEAFLALLAHKFHGNGLYLLDEPEAALSPQRQLAALVAIRQLIRQNSQFIIATHSPMLLAYPNAKIYRFDGAGVSETSFEETEHYQVTRDFLLNYPRRLSQLFGDE